MKKRFLKNEEIDHIITILKPKKNIFNMPIKSREAKYKKESNDLIKQLKTIKIYPNLINKLKNQIEKNYYSSMIQPGEAVGIIAGQSIGMQGTQLSLDSFHTSGSENTALTTGIPRLQELLNATKEPKNISCKLFLKKKFKNLIELRRNISKYILKINISSLIIKQKTQISLNKQKEKWYDIFDKLYPDINYSKLKHCICYQIDTNKLYEYNLNMSYIAQSVTQLYPNEFCCVFSSNIIGKLHIYIDINNIKPTNHIFINKNNYQQILLNEVAKIQIDNHLISGIQSIQNIFYKKDIKNNNWTIITKGGEFQKLFEIPHVDKSKLMTNNLWDIYNILGIEATREFLLNEFNMLMPNINKSHITILVDKMLYNGTISSITRYTMRKEVESPLRAASFEESLENITKACIRTTKEEIKGCSGSILTGSRIKTGSGLCDIKIDISKLKIKN